MAVVKRDPLAEVQEIITSLLVEMKVEIAQYYSRSCNKSTYEKGLVKYPKLPPVPLNSLDLPLYPDLHQKSPGSSADHCSSSKYVKTILFSPKTFRPI